ncbi:MAG: BACON domain-containing protein, partial [Candidatus Cryptobacteroides sp.]
MKNIIKSFLTLAGVAALFASCVQEAKPLASAVSVDKTELEFEGTDAPAQDVTVSADGDWFALAPEWITVEPPVGSGQTQVKISVAKNVNDWDELLGPRNATVSFCYGTSGICVLNVKQKGESGLDSSRQYSRIKTAEEFAAGQYLIVFNYDGKDNALKAFNADSESTYSYLYGDEVTVADDVIVMSNSTNAYEFEVADEGFRIKMSNGRYIFQSASYNNFYSTTDPAKADIWTVTFDETGLATIKNITVADKWMQWTSYGNAGAYTSAQDGAALPMLYKDSKPASDEVLVVPESIRVAASATSASIAVQSNKSWKVRCHDEWISSFTASGEGDGTIKLTFEANASKEESKTASIQVIGETTNYTIEFVQNKVETSVARLVAQITSTSSSAKSSYEVDLTDAGAVVSYVNGRYAFIEDKTGGILLYANNHGLTAGMKISGTVTGEGYLYSKLPEITSLEGAQTEEGGEIPLTELTLAELLDNYDRYLSCRILLKGVDVTDAVASSDMDGKIAQDGKDVAVRAQSATLSMPLGTCDFICFPSVYNTNKQLSLFENSQCTYSAYVTTLTVGDLSVAMGQTKKLSVT